MEQNAWITTLVLACVGAIGLLLPVTGVVAWESFSANGGTFNENVWSTSIEGGGSTFSQNIYSGDSNDEKGITLVRIGAPVLLIATIVVGLGALLVGMKRAPIGSMALLIGGVLAILACTLITIGYAQANADSDVSFNLALGFYLAAIGPLCAIGSGFMARMATTKTIVHRTQA